MNKHQIDQFWNKGFVVVESAVHKELIEEADAKELGEIGSRDV